MRPTRRSPTRRRRRPNIRHDAAEAETVVAINPDLVIAGSFTKRDTRDILTRLGYRVELLKPARSIDDSIAQIRQVAELVGHPERGEALVAKVEQARQAASRAASALPVRPTAAVYQRRGYVTGGDTLTGDLLATAGFTNSGAMLAGKTGGFVPLERLVADPPDMIVVAASVRRAEDQGTAFLAHPALAAEFPPDRRIVLAGEAHGMRRPVAAGGAGLAERTGAAARTSARDRQRARPAASARLDSRRRARRPGPLLAENSPSRRDDGRADRRLRPPAQRSQVFSAGAPHTGRHQPFYRRRNSGDGRLRAGTSVFHPALWLDRHRSRRRHSSGGPLALRTRRRGPSRICRKRRCRAHSGLAHRRARRGQSRYAPHLPRRY